MKIRIKFRKYGSVKYIGHLDLMRFFQKAIRRAGIDICYTSGFHPHQIMSFALPLGVGMIGEGEYFDIEVHTSDSSKESIRKLNRQMTEGLEVLHYVKIPDDAKKAMASVSAADYIYVFHPDELPDGWTRQKIDRMIRDYYQDRDVISVVKETKKSTRTLDLKPLIYRMESVEQNGMPGFFFRLSAGSTDNIKPELVLKDLFAFYNLEFDPLCFQRSRIEVYSGTPDNLKPLDAEGVEIPETVNAETTDAADLSSSNQESIESLSSIKQESIKSPSSANRESSENLG